MSKIQHKNIVDLLVNNAGDSIIGIDLSGHIFYCNLAACDMLRYSNNELRGMRYSDLLPKNASVSFDKIRESILFGEHPEPFLTSRLAKRKKRVSVFARYSPIADDAGKIIGISSVFRKISEFEKVANKAQALLETAPDAMVIVNHFGQIVLINAQTKHLFGYKSDELLGKEVELLIPDSFSQHHKDYRNKYIQKPKTRSMGQGMELYGKKKDGSTFPVEISLSPLKTEEGLFVSAAIRDITDRKRAENKFKDLLESAPDAVVIVGENGKIQLVNAQVENLFGYSKNELYRKNVEILIPKRYRNKHADHRNNYFTSPKLRPMGAGLELLGLRKNGLEFPVEISLSPLETEEGILVSASIRDITDRKEAESALQAFNQKLQTKNKELEQFAYIASHDLQEPLRTITGFTQRLAKNYNQHFDESGMRFMRFITEATDRMRQLIQGLLDYSRIGQDRELVLVNCKDLIMEIENDLGSIIADSKSILKHSELPKVMGYKTELRLLFQNLIANGIKFKKADEPPQINIFAKKNNGFWKFGIQDNGIGIENRYQDRIFTIFQRLHPRGKYEGTGIGLAHCRKIVELHGGDIWFESKINEGSIFYFTIPTN